MSSGLDQFASVPGGSGMAFSSQQEQDVFGKDQPGSFQPAFVPGGFGQAPSGDEDDLDPEERARVDAIEAERKERQRLLYEKEVEEMKQKEQRKMDGK